MQVCLYTCAPPYIQALCHLQFCLCSKQYGLVQKRYDEIVLEIKDMDVSSLYSSSLFRMIFES